MEATGPAAGLGSALLWIALRRLIAVLPHLAALIGLVLAALLALALVGLLLLALAGLVLVALTSLTALAALATLLDALTALLLLAAAFVTTLLVHDDLLLHRRDCRCNQTANVVPTQVKTLPAGWPHLVQKGLGANTARRPLMVS
jgi:hypothetical protein